MSWSSSTGRTGVHLLVNYPPKVSVSSLVNSLKGVSSRLVRKKNYPSIQKKLWGNALWSPSYFAGSCGGAPIAVIRQYIEQQQTPHWKPKSGHLRCPRYPLRPKGRSLPRISINEALGRMWESFPPDRMARLAGDLTAIEMGGLGEAAAGRQTSYQAPRIRQIVQLSGELGKLLGERLHEFENARTEGLRRAAVTHGGSSDGRPD